MHSEVHTHYTNTSIVDGNQVDVGKKAKNVESLSSSTLLTKIKREIQSKTTQNMTELTSPLNQKASLLLLPSLQLGIFPPREELHSFLSYISHTRHLLHLFLYDYCSFFLSFPPSISSLLPQVCTHTRI